jgi:1,2-diacylglycerol 3-alpha-glucosyltransferase
MRIGIFSDTYYPQLNGVATSVLMLNEKLRAKGHQVFVFTTTDPEAPRQETGVYRLPSLPFVGDRRMGMFYHPGLARMVRRLDLDLIHTNTEFSLGVFGRYMARELRLPMVHTMHTIYEDYTHYVAKFKMLDSLAKAVAKKISADFCNSADQVIVPTAKVKELLLSYGVTREISPIPTGIELDRFAPGQYSRETLRGLRREMGCGEDAKVLLFVGRIAEEKNIRELFYSLRRYLQTNRDVTFLLIGDGPERCRLESLSKELELEDKAIFAGPRPWDEIGMYYQTGDVFVNASQSEAQGLTYIEAMAAGLPVIAKADPCLDGILQDGVNGYAFHDGDGLVRALERVLPNAWERERLAQGALKTARRFSADGFADKVAEVYQKLLAENAYRRVS